MTPAQARDRGATMVEYALGIVLVVVAILIPIQLVEQNSGDQLDERGETAGSPLEQSLPADPPSSGPGPGPSPDPDPPVTPTVEVDELDLRASRISDALWSATVTVDIDEEGTNNGIPGVEVSGVFTVDGVDTAASCASETNNQGECSITLSNIPETVTTVTFTLTGLVGDINFTMPSPAPNDSVGCPSSVC